MDQIVYRPIGTIRSPFKTLSGMPIQPRGAQAAAGEIVVDPAYEPGLKDIDGFYHLILIYHLHKSQGLELTDKPFLYDHPRGVFATRAPRRPNAIGLSIVTLLGRSGNVLRVGEIDVADQTPLLDIKPYVPMFDAQQAIELCWLEGKAENFREKRSDHRFLK